MPNIKKPIDKFFETYNKSIINLRYFWSTSYIKIFVHQFIHGKLNATWFCYD